MLKIIIKIVLYVIGIIALGIVLAGAGIKLYNHFIIKDLGFDTKWEYQKLEVTNVRNWAFRSFIPYQETDSISGTTQSIDEVPSDSLRDSTINLFSDSLNQEADEDSSGTIGSKAPSTIHFSFGDPEAERDTIQKHQALMAGDQITHVNDTLVPSDSVWQVAKARYFETGKMKFTIMREGESIKYRASTFLNFKGINFGIILLLLGLLVGILFWVVGFVVYMKKPFGAPNVIYYLWSLTVFIFLSSGFFEGFDIHVFNVMRYIASRILILNSALFLHLFLIFPHKKYILTTRVKWLVYILIYLLPIMATPEAYLPPSSIPFTPLHLAFLGFIVVLGEYVLGIIALLRSYKRAKSEFEKKQVKVITRGILISGIPLITFMASVMMIIVVIFFLVGSSPATQVDIELASLPKVAGLVFAVFGALAGISLVVTVVTLPVVPLSFAYSILKYRILDVKLIVRRSLIYSLVTVFVVLTYIIIVFGFSRLTLGITGRKSQAAAILAALIVAILFNPVRLRIQNWVDKKFFRESYDFRRALEDLSEEIARVTNIDELIKKTSKQVLSLMHILHIVTFTKENSIYRVNCSLGFESEELENLIFYSEPKGLVDYLLNTRLPLLIPYAESKGDLKRISPGDLQKLKRINAVVVIPILMGDTLMGIQTYGDKLSEQYYSDSDIRLLKNLANQLGVALENARLYQEEIEKKRLENEIRLAREIQQNFLPKSIPVVKGFQFQGTNIPAYSVGGDYYDFISLPHGNLGITIADVAGKGYSGALLMSNLQAMLRMSVEQGLTPVQITTKLNKLIFENSPPDKFITFFYGQLNINKHELRYVNAGHNPPLLFTRNAEVNKLTKGGIVLGAFPDFTYQEGSIKIESGDILALYTDGVTETMNDYEEEFGEERFIDLVKNHMKDSPKHISETIMDSIKDFGNGRTQDDDITMIIIKKE